MLEKDHGYEGRFRGYELPRRGYGKHSIPKLIKAGAHREAVSRLARIAATRKSQERHFGLEIKIPVRRLPEARIFLGESTLTPISRTQES